MTTQKTTIKSLEQERATFAYKCAEQALKAQEQAVELSIGDKSAHFKSTNYGSYTKKIPMMIKTNGLGATLAFVLSKRSKEDKKPKPNPTQEGEAKKHVHNAYDLLYQQLTQWLTQDCKVTTFLFENKSLDLSKAVIEMNSQSYRAVTLETLTFLTWLRRFADGLIQEETETEE